MAFDIVPLPSAWDLPIAAGISAVSGSISGAGLGSAASGILGQALNNYLIAEAASQWGVFDASGNSVLSAAHVMSLDYDVSYNVPDGPVEDGSFVSYNKVRQPFTSRVSMVCDGSETGLSSLLPSLTTILSTVTGAAGLSVRTAFFNSLDTLAADLNLYTVVTPEKSYVNANIVAYRFRRSTQNGVTMPVVDIGLQEIRQTSTTAFQNQTTAQPQGSSTQQAGNVQAVPSQIDGADF